MAHKGPRTKSPYGQGKRLPRSLRKHLRSLPIDRCRSLRHSYWQTRQTRIAQLLEDQQARKIRNLKTDL